MSDTTTPDLKKVRVAEKYKARKYEYHQKYKSTLTKIYLASLVVTLALATYTYLTLSNNWGDDGCTGTWVQWALICTLVMHATNVVQ